MPPINSSIASFQRDRLFALGFSTRSAHGRLHAFARGNVSQGFVCRPSNRDWLVPGGFHSCFLSELRELSGRARMTGFAAPEGLVAYDDLTGLIMLRKNNRILAGREQPFLSGFLYGFRYHIALFLGST